MMAKRKVNELVALPKKAPKSLEAVPFETLCAYVFRSGSTFRIDGDGLEITIGTGAPEWLADLLNAHRGKLLHLARCQAAEAHIEARIRMLWATNDVDLVVRGSTYLYRKVAELEVLAGDPDGYNDPGNVFSDTAISCFREQLANVNKILIDDKLELSQA
jgi:hypothetical protein